MQPHPCADFEPDACFLTDSWTLGIPAATANQKRRLQARADHTRQSHALNFTDALSFVEASQWAAELLQAPTHALDHPAPNWNPPEWTPNWTPRTPDAHDRIPQGWTQRDEFPGEPLAESSDICMTPQRALHLLNLTAASAPGQIKSAYRRMVSQWHPDRLERSTEAVRQLATQKMAEINTAYHFLCTSPQFV